MLFPKNKICLVSFEIVSKSWLFASSLKKELKRGKRSFRAFIGTLNFFLLQGKLMQVFYSPAIRSFLQPPRFSNPMNFPRTVFPSAEMVAFYYDKPHSPCFDPQVVSMISKFC